MDITDVLYFLEFRYLPDAIARHGAKFVISAVKNPEIFNRIFSDMCKEAKLENTYTEEDWHCDNYKMSDDVFVMQIKFPEPPRSPLAYSAYIAFDAKFTKMRYFTLEMGTDYFTGETIVMVCEMHESGSHLNHGDLRNYALSLGDMKLYKLFYDMYMEEET